MIYELIVVSVSNLFLGFLLAKLCIARYNELLARKSRYRDELVHAQSTISVPVRKVEDLYSDINKTDRKLSFYKNLLSL